MALNLPTPGPTDVWGAINNANLTDLDTRKADASAVYTKTAGDARYIRTVNGNPPDGSGDVTVATGGGSVNAAAITDATTVGRQVLTASDAATARSTIGAGTSSLIVGTTSTTAKAGNYAPASTDLTDAGVTGRALIVSATAAAAKTALALDQANNTSDLAKPISTATQNALNLKQNSIQTYASQAAANTAATGGQIPNGALIVVTGP